MNITASNVTIMVKNMDKAIEFYETIGLTLQQRWDNHYAMIGAEGITLGLHPADEEKTSSGSVSVGFMVNDIEETKKLLNMHSIAYDEADGKSGHYLNFKDLDGTALYFVKPKW